MLFQPDVIPRRQIFKSIFIDGSFLFHCVQGSQVKIDYRKLKHLFMNAGDHLASASYYTALPSDAAIEEKHRSFIKILKKDVRVKVRSVPLLKTHDSTYSKGEDILLACDMVRGACLNYYDVAVLITGDGDFVPAVNCVQEAGKSVIVASFNSSLSHALELEANDVVYLDEHLDKIKLT